MLQILAIPDTVVIAGVRTPEKAQDLQKLTEKHGDRLHIVKLDLADIGTIQVRSTYDSDQLETICNDGLADDACTVTSITNFKVTVNIGFSQYLRLPGGC